MNNDFDILIAKFVLCNDFSNIQEDFEKLCDFTRPQTLSLLSCE